MPRRSGKSRRKDSGEDARAAGPAAPRGDELPARPARRYSMRPRLAAVLLASLGAVLLSVSFAPFNAWLLAYVALVPWVLALDSGTSRRWELLCCWLAGLAFWAANLYWLWWITLVGYAASVVYLSLYWLLAAAVLRAALRRRWPMWLTLPIVWVALEYLRAYVISGFPWFYLAHSQYARIPLIQIVDITGEYGLSFFVAMVNGAVVDILVSLLVKPLPRRITRFARIASATAAAGGVCGALLLYGHWRVGQYDEATSPGPVVGIVQQAFPISLTGRSASAEKILADHLAASERFIDAGCDLVIWPETMLPSGLNAEMLRLDAAALSSDDLKALGWKLLGPAGDQYTDSDLRRTIRMWQQGAELTSGEHLTGTAEYAEKIADLSRRLGCPVLAGGTTIHHNSEPINDRDRWVTRNSALWFEGGPTPSDLYYAKMHLVPFSEYVPFKQSWLGLHKVLRFFVPAVMDQLEPGVTREPFVLNRGEQAWRIAAPICYEGTFSRVCRELVMHNGRKDADILANLSNDGWFVYQFGGGPHRGSTEHPQHLVHYCFRAVENRVPVLRAVNTGISASIDSCGRIVAEVALTVEGYTTRTMIPGTLLLGGRSGGEQYPGGVGPEVLVDRRVTVYSLAGDVFAVAVSIVAIGLTGVLVWRSRAGLRRSGQEQVKGSE